MKRILLLLSLAVLTFGVKAQCADVFISEYTEGSGNNKAIEIYNPTPNPIDLSNYTFKRYSNGGTTNPDVLQLSGTIQPYDVVVISNGQTDSVQLGGGGVSPPCDPALRALADILDNDYPAPTYMNGNDALTIEKAGGVFVDIFGKPGEDPGVAWTDDPTANPPFSDSNGGDWWTANETLRRKATVESGVSALPAQFNPTLEWDTVGFQNWTGLGAHDCTCDPNYTSLVENKISATIYPNPINGSNLTVSASGMIAQVRFYNVIGQQVADYTFNGTQKTVKITNLNVGSGILMVEITLSNGATTVQRVVRK